MRSRSRSNPPASMLLALALAALVPLAGCLGGTDAPDTDGAAGAAKEQTDRAELEDEVFAFTGSATGAPVAPDVHEFPVEVQQGAVEVKATLTWDDAPVTDFRLTLVDPRGDVVARGFPETDGKHSAATTDPPRSGTWIIRVNGTRALETPFNVEVGVSYIVPLENKLADSVELRAGGFAEVNLIMEEGAHINWSFKSSNGPVKWNVHTHKDGETQYLAEGENTQYASNLTAPERHIYSLMWESTAPTTLTYSVEGAFRVHSHSQ